MAAKQETWWQKFGNAAQLASAVIAIFGFAAVLFQINELRNNSRAGNARQSYLGYMDMAFKNPAFAEADYDKIRAAGKDENVRYDMFVTYFLYACEEAMLSLEAKNEWHEACEQDLKYHVAFLCEKVKAEPDYLATYNHVTQDLVKSAMARYGVAPPDCKVRKS
jgi:hypothetical protein